MKNTWPYGYGISIRTRQYGASPTTVWAGSGSLGLLFDPSSSVFGLYSSVSLVSRTPERERAGMPLYKEET